MTLEQLNRRLSPDYPESILISTRDFESLKDDVSAIYRGSINFKFYHYMGVTDIQVHPGIRENDIVDLDDLEKYLRRINFNAAVENIIDEDI